MRVVGRAVFPSLGAGSLIETGLGEGAAVRAKLFDDPSTPGIYTLLLIRFAPGADGRAAATVADRLGYGSGDGCPPSLCMPGPQRPGDLNDFARLRTVPLVLAGMLGLLAGMLGLLAVATLGHTLLTAIRRRRRDLAVLKTLGFVGRQVVATVAWQATTLAAGAALIGLPLGVAGGRWAWRLFAGQLGVGAGPATPALVALLALPGAVLVANLIAALPALVAGRTRPALVLRSE
jgi:ABC-type antimicrobial peptide transport system permease subunit